MFGLEKNEKQYKPFEYDLEKEMKEDPEKIRQVLQRVADAIQEIKKALRSGTKPEEYETLGTLLHAYAALQRVLTRWQKTRK